ncbi:MFS transporter [Streptomyces sp. H39-S7]|uniref:MFS transporter n=1 Tax=Streptomyces sp. H39-S7 TaxID=3004357 RepID=UPI0022AF9260|nr:MFS transporter [Streptomyces sp. H39-S7]MCZ4125219.1 MFS transporter [Streptomyces sp. H39-S7]
MIGRTLAAVSGLSRDLRTLFLTTLLLRAGTVAYPFLAAHLLLTGGLNTGRIGAIVSAFGVGALCADLAAGPLLGRFGARRTMLGGLLAQALILPLVPQLHGAPALIAAVFFWGFAYEVFTPASYAATIDGSSPQDRKVAFSCNRLAINVGMGIGPAIGGMVFAVDPQALYWINAGAILAAAACLATRTRARTLTGRPSALAGTGRAQRRLVASTARQETQFWTAVVVSLPIQLAFSLPMVLASTYIIVGLHLPSFWVGVVFTVNAAVIVLCEIPLNVAMARLAHFPSLLIGYALTGAGFLCMGLATTGPTLVAATLVWTAGEMIVFPSLLTYVGALSAPDIRDRNMSLYSAGVNVAFIAAPQVALLLSGPAHPALPWTVAGSAVCLAFLLILAARTSAATWYEDPPAADTGGAPSATAPHTAPGSAPASPTLSDPPRPAPTESRP